MKNSIKVILNILLFSVVLSVFFISNAVNINAINVNAGNNNSILNLTNFSNNPSNISKMCYSLYWFDNEHSDCGYKEFCGMYLYYGLQTFQTKDQCEFFLSHRINQTEIKEDIDKIKEDLRKNMSAQREELKQEIKKQREKFIPWQKRNESECPDSCKCRGAVVSCETEDGKIINITAGNSGKFITIVINQTEINTSLQLETDTENNKTKLILNLPDGKNITLKILPDKALEKIQEKLGNMNYTVELKQTTITKGNETRMVYELVGQKPGRFLGLFKTKGKIISQVDAETGEVISLKKPWWLFFAKGI
jgi:hypothetical protein